MTWLEIGGNGGHEKDSTGSVRALPPACQLHFLFLPPGPSGITDLPSTGPIMGPGDSGSSTKQYYQSDLSTKVVSMQVCLQVAKGVIFSFSSSVSLKYGAHCWYREDFEWHQNKDLYVNSDVVTLRFIKKKM